MSSRIYSQHLPKQRNSWYLRTGQIHHFICKCRQVDQFANVLMHIHHPNHVCSSCGNKHYLDSVMFLHNKKVTRWSVFHWDIETVKTTDSWQVSTYTPIPVFDYALQKIRLKKIVLATTTLHFNGESTYNEDHPMIMEKYVYNHLESAVTIKELVDNELEEHLCRFILEGPIETSMWIKEEALSKYTSKEKLKLFSFFLKYPHLQEYDFFHWDYFAMFADISKEYDTVEKLLSYVFNHRKEKSIKKAYFESYMKSMEINGSYNHRADYFFARYIDDRNFLLELIRMNVKTKHILFNEGHMVVIEELLTFLKEHYTERAISKLFTNMGQYSSAVRDTIWLFRGDNANHVRENFRKVPLNFRTLHNEFIRIQNLLNIKDSGKEIFDYHENDLKAEGKKGTFTYELPKTIHTLSTWGRKLHNCMASYSREIHKGRSIIFAVFKEDELYYAIEIRGSKIVQALGKYNRVIEEQDREEIDTWLKEVYVAGWMGFSSII